MRDNVRVFWSHQNLQRFTSLQLPHILAIRLFDSFFRFLSPGAKPNFPRYTNSHSPLRPVTY